MKKLLLSFLSFMGLGFSAWAQSHINIELLSATYTTTPAVQFRVSWNAIPVVAGKTHNSKIWLWVDFRKIENNQPSGTWTRATVASPSPGTVAPETDKGFWLQGNSGSYSQIVTVALTNITPNTQFNWCAYASDCPPNIGDYNNGTYTLRGMPPFTLKDANGVPQTVPDNTIAKSVLTITPVTMTDATECPGYFCKYIGFDLYIDDTHKCDLRASGAQNWEAWIKDTRDGELYRIVEMPDDKWWLAQNVKLASYNSATVGSAISVSGCTADKCGRWYTYAQATKSYGESNVPEDAVQGVCPNGWFMPSVARWQALKSSLANNDNAAVKFLTSANCVCTTDQAYGWTSDYCLYRAYTPTAGSAFLSAPGENMIVLCWEGKAYGHTCPIGDQYIYDGYIVRCLQ